MADRAMFQPRPASYQNSTSIISIPVSATENIAATYIKNPDAYFTVLYSHGNAEDIGYIYHFLQLLNQHGFSVIAYDYRGYGLSDGKPSENNVYQDAEAALYYLTQKLKIPKKRIILFGRSIGSGPTVELAAKEPVAGVILESPFTSIFRVVTKIKLLPFDKFDNLAKIGRIKCPILIIHGQQDRVIPFNHSKKLYRAAQAQKILFAVPDGGHNNLLIKAGEKYWQQIELFTERLKNYDKKN